MSAEKCEIIDIEINCVRLYSDYIKKEVVEFGKMCCLNRAKINLISFFLFYQNDNLDFISTYYGVFNINRLDDERSGTDKYLVEHIAHPYVVFDITKYIKILNYDLVYIHIL